MIKNHSSIGLIICCCLCMGSVGKCVVEGNPSALDRIRVRLTRVTQVPDESGGSDLEVSYFGNLAVGTPKQMFTATFDTGLNEIWLPGSDANQNGDNKNKQQQSYECERSTTCKRRGIEYTIEHRGTHLTSHLNEDVLTLFHDFIKENTEQSVGPQIDVDQQFLVVSKASDQQFAQKPYDGAIGLGLRSQSSSGTRNLLFSIREAMESRGATAGGSSETDDASEPNDEASTQTIPQRCYKPPHKQTGLVNANSDLVFAFWFNPISGSSYGGELMLGDVDERRYTGEIRYHRVNSLFRWQLPVESVQLGRELVSRSDGCSAIFETGVDSLVGPSEDVERIHSLLATNHHKTLNLMLVDCSLIYDLPSITFQIDGHRYTIESNQYIKQLGWNNEQLCYVDIRAHSSKDWIFGATFISAYYTVFNISHKQIGLATSF